MIPTTLTGRAQMYRWIFFLVTEIEQPLWRNALHSQIYTEYERRPEEIKLASRDCKKMVAVLEDHMRQRKFLVGDRLTVADFNAAYTLDWANEAKMIGDAPRLREYLEAMYARPKAPPTIAESFAALRVGKASIPGSLADITLTRREIMPYVEGSSPRFLPRTRKRSASTP